MASMHETVFGHFDHASDARAAYAQLRRGQAFRPKMNIYVRTPGKAQEELPIAMTDARGAMLRGIVLSGVAGFVVLGLLVAFGASLVGFSPAYAWLGAMGGMFLGALAGMLQGSAEPHPHLQSLEAEGGVLLVVSAHEEDDRVWAQEVMRRHEARIEGPEGAPRSASPAARHSVAR
jgi:hypothetical protein